MKRAAVYSRSGRSRVPEAPTPAVPAQPALGWRKRHSRSLRIGAGIAAALVLGAALWMLGPGARHHAASRSRRWCRRCWTRSTPTPTAADAYESILPSVVHVRGLPDAPDADVASGRETAKRHRRGHRRHRHHPHQPARGARREGDQGRVRRRPGVRGGGDRRAARARSRGAAGEDHPRRPDGGDAALDRRACARATRWSRSASRSASARRCRPA